MTKGTPLISDTWELYHVDEDFSEANDLASTNPEKLRELRVKFNEVAAANHVFPIDDRRAERFNAASAGRPDVMGDRSQFTVYEGMTGLMENVFINTKMRNYTVTADIDVPAAVNGVLLAQAGKFGGWTLYAKNGVVHHEYNFFGLERTNIASKTPLKPGRHKVVYEFVIDEQKPGSGGSCSLAIDGQVVANGRIPKTQPFAFSGDEGADVGMDGETNVSDDYKQGDNEFTGKIEKIVIEVKK